jgi:hypothetical protein
MTDPHARNLGLAVSTLVASSATLVCCVLPAALVSIGAGAALVGLITAVPQLIWLSERKLVVFAVAGALLAFSGLLLWRARALPCPVDPQLARSCMRLRKASVRLYIVSVGMSLLGAAFAYVLPLIAERI